MSVLDLSEDQKERRESARRMRAICRRLSRYEAGREAGKKWAKARATPEQGRHLSEAFADTDSVKAWVGGEFNPYGISGALCDLLNGTRPHKVRSAYNGFWQEAIGDFEGINDPDVADGFIVGALKARDSSWG